MEKKLATGKPFGIFFWNCVIFFFESEAYENLEALNGVKSNFWVPPVTRLARISPVTGPILKPVPEKKIIGTIFTNLSTKLIGNI